MEVLITTIVTIALALIGYVATYLNNIRMSQHQARLERINRQLSELYGPMLATLEDGERAWRYFLREHRPNQRSFFTPGVEPNAEELELWRRWMTTVFMPRNRALYELVVSKADLLLDREMPSTLLDLCAHVAAWEVVVSQWAANDFSEYRSVIKFPKQAEDYARRSFSILKSEQAKLLGRREKLSTLGPMK